MDALMHAKAAHDLDRVALGFVPSVDSPKESDDIPPALRSWHTDWLMPLLFPSLK